MKKTALITLTFISLWTVASSQELKLGIKAGMNFSQLKTNGKWLSSNSKTGYQAGLWGRVGIAGFHIQPEAYLTSKSVFVHYQPSGDITSANEYNSGNVKFTNIDIPILLGTKFGIGPLSARLQAGPLFSIVLKEKNGFKGNWGAWEKPVLSNYKKQFSSLVFGAGIDVLRFSADLRYELGLGNISQLKNEKQKLNLWTLSVGYSLF